MTKKSLFLEKDLQVTLNYDEISEIVCPVQSEEVDENLHNKVDLDSSPSEEGITSEC